MPEKTAAQKRAQKAYMEKFVRVEIRMDAKRRDSIQAHAAAQGESVNGFINRAIDQTIAQDAIKGPISPVKAEAVSLPSEASKCAPAASESRAEDIADEG